MSLLSADNSGRKTKPVEERYYRADWTGNVTPGEIADLKEGDVDRESGQRRCTFCRLPKPLKADGCCDAYCSKNEHGWVKFGRSYPFDKTDRGREWLSLGFT